MKTEGTQRAQSVVADSSGIKWVMLIYFCSGICSLIDEVVWVRLLKLTLGNTVYATSIVVSMFMAGLALGALIMGRNADRVRKRLRLYAMLEVCATISALSLPWVLQFADVVYRWFFVKYQPSLTALLLVQVMVSAAILLIPAMVMGSTLPLLGRYVTALQNRVGRLVGRLYSLNMLGAALGCFLAGFVLIRMVGVMGTLYIAAGINLLVAFGGWMLSRFYDVSGESLAEVPAARQHTAGIQMRKAEGPGRYVLMLAFFVSGLTSIGYELIWMRSIVFLLGGFTYVFSAVLTVYLLGNVIGAWIGSRLSKSLTNPAVGLGVSLTCLGILGIFYIPLLSIWSSTVKGYGVPLFGGLLTISSIKITILPLFHSTFLFLLPAITMGIGFPLALQAWSNYGHEVGQTTGTVYGVNTIGAVMGGAVTGFLLIPLMGIQLSITVLGVVGIWLGGVMLQMNLAGARIVRRVVYLAVAVGLTVAAVRIPSSLFEYRFVQRNGSKLLAVKEGITTTVSVHEGAGGDLTLATSGIQVAGDKRGVFRIPQKILGHLGIFLNKNTRQVLSVGFGSGETTACMSRHNLERIDGVEIAPELVEVALKFFTHLNLGERQDEKVNMIYMDVKNYLHLTNRHYDLIVNDCTNPRQFAENASLFTKEYFQDALDHLNPGGIFASYLPVSEMPVSCTDSILGTFAEVFPYVTIWFPTTAPSGYNFWYLAGSAEPALFSPGYIDNQLQRESVRSSAAYINFHNSQYVLSCYIANKDDLKRYLSEFNLNSDFRPYVEFNTDKNEEPAFKRRWFAQFLAKVRHDRILEHIDWAGMSEYEQEKWRREHELFYNASTYLLKSRVERNVSSRLQSCYWGLKLIPGHPAFLEVEAECFFLSERALNEGQAEEVIEGMSILLQHYPDCAAAWLIKSWALKYKNEMKGALDAAEKAVQHAPYNWRAQNNLGLLLMKLRQTDRAVAHYNRAIQLIPNEPMLNYNLGLAFWQQGRFDEAISQFRQGLQIQPDAVAHCYLGELLEKQGRNDEAVEEYRKALRINPNYPGLLERLNAASGQ